MKTSKIFLGRSVLFSDDLDRVCTTDDIQRMVYLDAVVKVRELTENHRQTLCSCRLVGIVAFTPFGSFHRTRSSRRFRLPLVYSNRLCLRLVESCFFPFRRTNDSSRNDSEHFHLRHSSRRENISECGQIRPVAIRTAKRTTFAVHLYSFFRRISELHRFVRCLEEKRKAKEFSRFQVNDLPRSKKESFCRLCSDDFRSNRLRKSKISNFRRI